MATTGDSAVVLAGAATPSPPPRLPKLPRAGEAPGSTASPSTGRVPVSPPLLGCDRSHGHRVTSTRSPEYPPSPRAPTTEPFDVGTQEHGGNGQEKSLLSLSPIDPVTSEEGAQEATIVVTPIDATVGAAASAAAKSKVQGSAPFTKRPRWSTKRLNRVAPAQPKHGKPDNQGKVMKRASAVFEHKLSWIANDPQEPGPDPRHVSADKSRQRLLSASPMVRERLPSVRGVGRLSKNPPDKNRQTGALQVLGTKGTWQLGSNCAVYEGKSDQKRRADRRNEVDTLTDYLMALAKPSKNELEVRERDPLLRVGQWYHKDWVRVYEDGYSASNGLVKNYWLQRWEEEEEDGGEVCKVWRTPDNQVFHHLQPRVREFFDLGGYRAFPDVVAVEVQIRELLEVDCAKGVYRAGFIVSLRWYDAHFDSTKYKDVKNERVYARSIPYITFTHVDLGDEPIGVPEDASNLDTDVHSGMATLRKDGPHGGDPPGVLYHSFRVQATFRDETDDLTLFPFDQQTLSMRMRLWGSTMRDSPDEHRVLLPINVAMNLEQEHPEWITLRAECESHKERGARQDLEVIIHLRRRAAFFIINVAVIIFLLTSMCFAVFSQSINVEEYGDRTQTTLTLLLTTVAYKFFVNDMFPKISYLTLMDMYIFAGLVTSMAIFGLNTITICRDFPDNCNEQRRTEYIGLGAIGAFWLTSNAIFGVRTFKYLRTIFWTESNRIVLSSSKAKSKEKAKAEKELYEQTRKRERDYIEDLSTVQKRRSRALVRFRERELHEVENRKSSDSVVKNSLHANIKASLKNKTSTTSRERQYRGSVVVPVADDTGIPQLLRRAALRSEEGLLAPVLEEAKLTGEMLRDLYKNGKGADALNSLLEESGVTEPSHRVSIIGALDEDGTRMERLITDLIMGYSRLGHVTADENFVLPDGQYGQIAKTTLFLVLQGAPSYLWKESLACTDTCISRVDFLRKIDDWLARVKNCEAITFSRLRVMANCIFCRLLLTSPLLGRAEHLYSNRVIRYKVDDQELGWPTQTWTGYLIKAEGSKWRMEEKQAVLAIEVGTKKIKTGYMAIKRDKKGKLHMVCHELTGGDFTADTTKISILYTKSVLFAHPYMVYDKTMAHRPMLRQVLRKFDLIKSQRHPTNYLFNPNKELLGFYNAADDAAPSDGFHGAAFSMGDRACEISVARIVGAVERYVPGEVGLMCKELHTFALAVVQYAGARADDRIVLTRSGNPGSHAWGYRVTWADSLPLPDNTAAGYQGMDKVDLAYTLLSFASLANEASKTHTDHLVEVCDALTSEWILPTLAATRESECAQMSSAKTHSYVKRIMLFGTAQLHERVMELEKFCGLLSTEHLSAVADFCAELVKLHDPAPTSDGAPSPYHLTFEVLSPEDQAACNHEAVKQAICCISPDPASAVMNDFRRAVLDDDRRDSFGSVSWNDLGISSGANFQGSCQGLVGRDLFTLPVGLVSVMGALLFEAELQNSHALSRQELTNDAERLRRNLATLRLEDAEAPAIRFADVAKAVAVVQHDLSRSLKQLNAELQPFHPSVIGPHNEYDVDKARRSAQSWLKMNQS